MQAAFWHAMWDSGKVGFHQDDINAYLTSYWQTLRLEGDEKVFVPLCGKTLDMLWLQQQGHAIVGVELSPKALEEFVTENTLAATPVEHSDFSGYQLEGMALYCGDYFKLSHQECGGAAAVYDRAALIALPEAMRQDYVQHLLKILPDQHQILLVIMEYDQSLMDGPPFSVSEEAVFSLYASHYEIHKLAEFPLARKGHPMTEKVFHLKTKPLG